MAEFGIGRDSGLGGIRDWEEFGIGRNSGFGGIRDWEGSATFCHRSFPRCLGSDIMGIQKHSFGFKVTFWKFESGLQEGLADVTLNVK